MAHSARTLGRPALANRRTRRSIARLRDLLSLVDPTRVAVVLGLWAAWYATYRLYYAFGGEVGMIGEPRSTAQFRHINLAGGVIILLAALLPALAAATWRYERTRRLITVVGWLALVGCWTHSVTNETLRLLSVTGAHPTQLSPEFWLTVDRQKADVQDMLLNEPWFFIEGCLWGLYALFAVRPRVRRRWLVSAAIASAGASTIGVLSGVGAIPRFHVG